MCDVRHFCFSRQRHRSLRDWFYDASGRLRRGQARLRRSRLAHRSEVAGPAHELPGLESQLSARIHALPSCQVRSKLTHLEVHAGGVGSRDRTIPARVAFADSRAARRDPRSHADGK
jgi:hypothetical protein